MYSTCDTCCWWEQGLSGVIKHGYEVHRLRKKKDLYNQDEYLNDQSMKANDLCVL